MARTWLTAAVAAGLLTMAAPAQATCDLSAHDAAHAGDDSCARAWLDANLRLNQLQFVGTADSYKSAPSDQMLSLIRMGGRKDAEALDFGEPPLRHSSMPAPGRWNSTSPMIPRAGCSRIPAGASMARELLDPALCRGHVPARLQGDPCAGCGLPLHLPHPEGLPDRGGDLEPDPSRPPSHPDRAACQ